MLILICWCDVLSWGLVPDLALVRVGSNKVFSFLYQHCMKFHLLNILQIFVSDLILWTAIGDMDDPEHVYLCNMEFTQLCSILHILRQA
jgi:hypothetical protein